ncbi:MAG: tetratricopeptide repeat protein, partial [Verrucomicrobia bacterium]|nr:tetratricopeptide repeat protein [Verrucomicrobiota bacterium]
MFKLWFALTFSFLQLASTCYSCGEEIRIGRPHDIAQHALVEARKYGLYPTIYFSFGNCCYFYSSYRAKFHYLMEYAQEEFESFDIYVSQDIEEIGQRLAEWRTCQSEYAAKQIACYEPILNRKSAALREKQAYYPIVQNILSTRLNDIASACEQIYTFCMENHGHTTSACYERGLIYYDQGKYLESVNDISKVIDRQDDVFSQLDYLLIAGKSYSNVGLYNEAIAALNQLLAQDPKNKEALLERAVVYFETGNFDQSIEDFLSSGLQSKALDSSRIDFATGFWSGATEGFKEFSTEFFPSLLSTARGLGSVALWIVSDPLGFSEEMYNACHNFIQFLSHHPLPEIVEAMSPQLKAL